MADLAGAAGVDAADVTLKWAVGRGVTGREGGRVDGSDGTVVSREYAVIDVVVVCSKVVPSQFSMESWLRSPLTAFVLAHCDQASTRQIQLGYYLGLAMLCQANNRHQRQIFIRNRRRRWPGQCVDTKMRILRYFSLQFLCQLSVN